MQHREGQGQRITGTNTVESELAVQCSDEMSGTLCSAGLLTSVVLQQDYGGVHYAGAGVNRAGRCRDAVLIESGGRDLVLVYAFG